jgi:hypothetical protein
MYTNIIIQISFGTFPKETLATEEPKLLVFLIFFIDTGVYKVAWVLRFLGVIIVAGTGSSSDSNSTKDAGNIFCNLALLHENWGKFG